jgi:cell division protein FtsW
MTRIPPMAATFAKGKPLPSLYDRWLLVAAVGLIGIGLLMVTSSSIVMSYRLFHTPFHYVLRQAIYLLAGLVAGIFVARVPLQKWYQWSPFLIIISFVLLVLVLVPGLGRQVNGSTRWLGFAGFGIQISELVKLLVIVYLAGYLVRRKEEVSYEVSGFIKPMFMLAIVAVLLLKEPDFGAVVVITMTALGMMFLAGVRIQHFVVLFSIVLIAFVALAVSSPYRMARITAFLNPWQHAFQSGYQLTQSLIAFGRGGWWGVGLGESVQKLFYLPEAHTDFIFAVMAEELGFMGVLVVIALYGLMVTRALLIGRRAQKMGELFAAYVAYGIGLWIAMQVLINIGVNTGLLPTKGLTLPFISYGGSSLLVMCIVLVVLFRIDHEIRLQTYGFSKQWRKNRNHHAY